MFSSLSIFIGVCIVIDIIDGFVLLCVIATARGGMSVACAITVIVCILLVSLSLTLVALLAEGNCHALEPKISKSRIELISVANGTHSHGSGSFGWFGVFLFDSNDTYRYYYKADSGYIEQGSTPVRRSHITYTDETPYLEIVETTSVSEARFLIFKDRETRITTEYIYHIPKGSVVANFELR